MKIPEIRWTMDGDPAYILKFMRKHKPELSEPDQVMVFLEVEDFSLRIKFKDHKQSLYLRPREVLMYLKERDVFCIGTPVKDEPCTICTICGGIMPDEPGVVRCGSPDCMTPEEIDGPQED